MSLLIGYKSNIECMEILSRADGARECERERNKGVRVCGKERVRDREGERQRGRGIERERDRGGER